MRHPMQSDLEWVDDALDTWPCTLRWDVRGHTPSAPSLVGRLWDGVVTQRVAVDDHGEPSGLLQLIDVDLVNRTARLEGIARSCPSSAASLRQFVATVFHDFPLRVAHIFAVADAMDVEQLVPDATEVGRLREHHLRGRGDYEDVVIYEIRASAAKGGS